MSARPYILIPKGLVSPNQTIVINIPEDLENLEQLVVKQNPRRACSYQRAQPYGVYSKYCTPRKLTNHSERFSTPLYASTPNRELYKKVDVTRYRSSPINFTPPCAPEQNDDFCDLPEETSSEYVLQKSYNSDGGEIVTEKVVRKIQPNGTVSELRSEVRYGPTDEDKNDKKQVTPCKTVKFKSNLNDLLDRCECFVTDNSDEDERCCCPQPVEKLKNAAAAAAVEEYPSAPVTGIEETRAFSANEEPKRATREDPSNNIEKRSKVEIDSAKLTELEEQERKIFCENLKRWQEARRKLIYDVAKMSTCTSLQNLIPDNKE